MTQQHYSIRRAVSADLPAILEIENDSFSEDNFSRRELKYLIEKSQGGCFILEIEDEPTAYTSILSRSNASNLRIYSIAVHSKARGQRLGQAMMEYILQFAKEKGFGSVTLEVKVTNKTAISLYQKNGFEIFAVKEGYYHDGSNAFCMKRAI